MLSARYLEPPSGVYSTRKQYGPVWVGREARRSPPRRRRAGLGLADLRAAGGAVREGAVSGAADVELDAAGDGAAVTRELGVVVDRLAGVDPCRWCRRWRCSRRPADVGLDVGLVAEGEAAEREVRQRGVLGRRGAGLGQEGGEAAVVEAEVGQVDASLDHAAGRDVVASVAIAGALVVEGPGGVRVGGGGDGADVAAIAVAQLPLAWIRLRLSAWAVIPLVDSGPAAPRRRSRSPPGPGCHPPGGCRRRRPLPDRRSGRTSPWRNHQPTCPAPLAA